VLSVSSNNKDRRVNSTRSVRQREGIRQKASKARARARENKREKVKSEQDGPTPTQDCFIYYVAGKKEMLLQSSTTKSSHVGLFWRRIRGAGPFEFGGYRSNLFPIAAVGHILS
jgi:hypothetical protein